MSIHSDNVGYATDGVLFTTLQVMEYVTNADNLLHVVGTALIVLTATVRLYRTLRNRKDQ